MLNKKSNVTDMNKEIYKMDIEEEMATAQEIEDEEYNMDNIPDDDDYNSSGASVLLFTFPCANFYAHSCTPARK